MTALTVPNKMAVWLCIMADICGTPSLLLRGVNFRPKAPSIKEVNGPWLHVPSITYPVLREDDFTAEAARLRVGKQLPSEWPGLIAAMLAHRKQSQIEVFDDQDFTGFWSGTKGQDLVTPVTRLVINLGKLDEEPKVIYRPNEKLGFGRDPVFWVPVDQITQTPGCVPVDQGVRRTPYMLSSTHTVIMETDNLGGKAKAIIQDMPFQETVAEAFKKFLRNDLFPTREYRKPAATLTLDPIHG